MPPLVSTHFPTGPASLQIALFLRLLHPGSDHTKLLAVDLNSHYLMAIRFVTLFTPFTSLASLVAKLNSAALLAFPYKVTTPRFVSTVVLRALVEWCESNVILTWAVMDASSIF